MLATCRRIISQLPVAIKFHCPVCQNLKSMMKALPAVNLDVLSVGPFGCMMSIDLYSRFFFTVAAPFVAILLAQLWARLPRGKGQVEVRQAGSDEGETTSSKAERVRDATQLSMLIIFLTYPTMSSTIFTMCKSGRP